MQAYGLAERKGVNEGSPQACSLKDKGKLFTSFGEDRDKVMLELRPAKSARLSNILSPVFAGLAALISIVAYFNQQASDSTRLSLLQQLQQQTKEKTCIYSTSTTEIN